MRSVKQILTKDFVQTVGMYYTILLFIINVGFFVFNYSYEQQITKQNEVAFATIVEHIVNDDGTEAASKYVEHYSHIHKTMVQYYYDGELVYETPTLGKNLTVYTIQLDGDPIGELYIDSSNSVNTLLSSTFFWVVNIFLVITYVSGIVLFHIFMKKRVREILQDVETIRLEIAQKEFKEEELELEEFIEIQTELIRLDQQFKDLDRLRTSQLRTIAHDMKTPLTILLQYVEGVEDHVLEFDDKTVSTIKREIGNLNQLIESINREEDEFRLETVSVKRLLQNVIDRFLPIYKTKNIELVLNPSDDITLETNQEDLTRVIMNLLSNSYYYSEPNKRVTVTLKQTESVVIQVMDEGIGIGEEDLKHIFEERYRVELAKGQNQKGSGLGLYVVKTLVEDLGGTISVDSVLNKGTTVSIEF